MSISFSLSQDANPKDEDLTALYGAAQGVRDALNQLLTKVREGGIKAKEGEKYDETCDHILGATDRLFNSMGNAGEMVKQAKILAQVRIGKYVVELGMCCTWISIVSIVVHVIIIMIFIIYNAQVPCEYDQMRKYDHIRVILVHYIGFK